MKKNSGIIISEGICTDLDLLPDLMNDPAPRLSQHMISTFETFRSQMDLHSNCSRNDENEELQMDNGATESLPNIDSEVGHAAIPNEDAMAKNKYSTSSQCIAIGPVIIAEDNLKKTKSSNLLPLGRKSSRDFEIVGTSSSISSVAKHERKFAPSSGRIGDIWKYENDLEESECGSTLCLSKELVLVGDTDTETDEEFIKKTEEVHMDYSPFETPKKQISPLISTDDYYYRSSSSDESDIEVLIKIPKMAFVDKVFDQLSSACPNCRVVAVDVPEKNRHVKEMDNGVTSSKDFTKISEVPKPYTNIFGENPLENNAEKNMNFFSSSQEFIVANADDKRRRKQRPFSIFPHLHNRFDPSRKLLRRSKSSITDPIKESNPIWKSFKNQGQEDPETTIIINASTQTKVVRPCTSLVNPCWTLSLSSEIIEVTRNTQSVANDPIIWEPDVSDASFIDSDTQAQSSVNNTTQTKIIDLKNSSTSPNPSMSFKTDTLEHEPLTTEVYQCSILATQTEATDSLVEEPQRNNVAHNYSGNHITQTMSNIEISSLAQKNCSASCSKLQVTNDMKCSSKPQQSESALTGIQKIDNDLQQDLNPHDSIHNYSTQQIIPLKRSFTQRNSAESELEVTGEVNFSKEILATMPTQISGTVSVVKSRRSIDPSLEHSHKSLNAGYCEIILDKPQEEILTDYEREKGIKILEAQLFRHKDIHYCSSKTKTPGKRRNRNIQKNMNRGAIFFKNQKVKKDKQKSTRHTDGAGEHQDSHSSSSCFSLPDEPDIDVYNFSANVKEGEFPFIVEDPSISHDCQSNYYSSGDEMPSNGSCDVLKNDESKYLDLPGKTTTSVKSSKISMYSVGASLPPKPRAIRSTRSMNSNSSMSPRAQKGRLAIQGKEEKMFHRVSSSTISVRSLPSDSSYATTSDVNSNTTKIHTSDSMSTLDVSRRWKPEAAITAVVGNERVPHKTRAENKKSGADIGNNGKRNNYHLCLKSRQRFRQWYLLTVNWCSRRNKTTKKWLKFLYMGRKKASTST